MLKKLLFIKLLFISLMLLPAQKNNDITIDMSKAIPFHKFQKDKLKVIRFIANATSGFFYRQHDKIIEPNSLVMVNLEAPKIAGIMVPQSANNVIDLLIYEDRQDEKNPAIVFTEFFHAGIEEENKQIQQSNLAQAEIKAKKEQDNSQQQQRPESMQHAQQNNLQVEQKVAEELILPHAPERQQEQERPIRRPELNRADPLRLQPLIPVQQPRPVQNVQNINRPQLNNWANPVDQRVQRETPSCCIIS